MGIEKAIEAEVKSAQLHFEELYKRLLDIGQHGIASALAFLHLAHLHEKAQAVQSAAEAGEAKALATSIAELEKVKALVTDGPGDPGLGGGASSPAGQEGTPTQVTEVIA